jgi:hypothetical protein
MIPTRRFAISMASPRVTPTGTVIHIIAVRQRFGHPAHA